MFTIDFETEAIVGNPTARPPKPVGVSIKRKGYNARYWAWGHPEGNNCTYEQARDELGRIMLTGAPLLFHNAKFDLAVLWEHFRLMPMRPELVHDSMFLIFLADPYAETFSLKPSAERLLGMPPEEQDAVRDWVLSHVPGATAKTAGAYICLAPGTLVEPYANGDTLRTERIFTKYIDKVPFEAYRREQLLLPALMESEQRGVRLDVARLGEDLRTYERTLVVVNDRLHNMLGDCNLDSGAELADALDRAGMVGEWVLTPTGKRSTARGNLEAAIANKELLGLLQYRGALSHCLSSFARPWMELGQEYNGRLHPEWNQVRQNRGGDSKGTRTGRLSCMKPNFQNMPNEYSDKLRIDGLPELPIMRKYLLADEGMRWLKRDYSQQELRVLAHYSEGKLYHRYREDPTIDAHTETGKLIQEITGLELPRKHVKITGFSIIYGAGNGKLAESLSVPYNEAASIKGSYLYAMPEVRELMDSCQDRGKRGLPITTWGGRQYYVEPPKLVGGRMMNYAYKLLNYLIQGSSADCTKQAVVDWNSNRGNGQFLATVHDEINIQAPEETWQQDMAKLREAMESIPFDIKMLSDGFVGQNWQELEDCE